jgi:glycosyltransferase involved in cell wall biosynthesis
MIDVIMLAYQPTDKTYHAIKSILENTENINLIVVKARQGVAQNRNEWMKRKLSDFYVMCDDDVEVAPGWLPALLGEVKDDTGIVVPKMNYPNGKMFKVEQCLKDGEIEHACGALMLMRNIGITADENYVGSQWEDYDICNQYKAKGYKIVSTHKTSFTHHTQGINAENFKNKEYYYSKWQTK